MVGQNRGTTGTLQGTNRRGNLRPKAENRIFRGNLAYKMKISHKNMKFQPNLADFW